MISTPRIAVPLPTSTDEEYNRRCWQQYAYAVHQSGGVPVSIDLHAAPEEVARLASSCDAVLLPGSPADVQPEKYGQRAAKQTAQPDPAREAVDELLLQDAFNLHKPIFGVCYGHQSLNVWKGGSLLQHLSTSVDHECGAGVIVAHSVRVAPEAGDLERCLGSGLVQVNSSHHQAVSAVGDGLRAAAVCPADGTIEAVVQAHREGGFVLGVQWHPERTFDVDPGSRALFRAFIAASCARRLAE